MATQQPKAISVAQKAVSTWNLPACDLRVSMLEFQCPSPHFAQQGLLATQQLSAARTVTVLYKVLATVLSPQLYLETVLLLILYPMQSIVLQA
jgi:hypothetical protein